MSNPEAPSPEHRNTRAQAWGAKLPAADACGIALAHFLFGIFLQERNEPEPAASLPIHLEYRCCHTVGLTPSRRVNENRHSSLAKMLTTFRERCG